MRSVKEIDERISRELNDLFLIDRLWDIEKQIKPALAAGAVVLLDRGSARARAVPEAGEALPEN